MLLLLSLACTPVSSNFHPPKDDSGDTGRIHSSPPDSEDSIDDDGDLDDDGWTPEEGDCNDDDIRVNPGREEVVGDQKDNDCDGRSDERFWGVGVAWANGGGASSILTIDLVRGLEDEIKLDNDCYPLWIAQRGDGWVINNGQASVALVDSSGHCTDIADFSETDYGVWGVATALDGTIYATTVDGLWKIGEDGTTEEVATWTVDFEDFSKHEAAITTISVDAATGKVGMFDYFGGFATWDSVNGFENILVGDYNAPLLSSFGGAVQDGGRFYNFAVDNMAGTYGIYSWNFDSSAWEVRDAWAVADFAPSYFTIDSDSGDAYVSANGGWYATVWRVIANSGYSADLYSTNGTEEHRPFNGIVPIYE
jgi:hypothetical protein